MRGLWRLGLLALAATPFVASAQAPEPRIDIALPVFASVANPADPTVIGPAVRGLDILANGSIRDLLRSGFPARLHYHLELWGASGVFNTLEGAHDWDVIARYDPLTHHFRAARIDDTKVTILGDFDRPAGLDSAIAVPTVVPIIPHDRGRRYYYTVALDVDVISLSDLDEVERWLRGEFSPAVHGQRNPSGVVGRGIRTLFLRIIGAEKRHYETRTRIFRAE